MKKTKILLASLGLGLALIAPIRASAATTNRISGDDRYETAIQISRSGWATTSKYAILATGEDFPDALCAAPLAKKYDAPILLTTKNTLLTNVKEEIQRLKVEQVYIVGGSGVVSDDVKEELEAMNVKCTRIYGNDRYETSEKVAEMINTSADLGDIAVATGEDFPDAISISSIAAQKGMPILLTGKNYIPDSISQYLNGKNVKNSYVIGGVDVVSDQVSSKLQNVTRLCGHDRYDTNATVLSRFASDLNFSPIYIATGADFPDALTAAALAVKTNSPLCLIGDYNSIVGLVINPFSLKFQDDVHPAYNITAIGGTDVVPNSSIDTLINICSSGYLTYRPYENIASTGGNYSYYVKLPHINEVTGLYKIGKSENSSTLIDKDAADLDTSVIEQKSNIYVLNDYIYYENTILHSYDSEGACPQSDGIYKIKSDGSGKTKICNDSITEMIVSGDSIYYINSSDKNKLYKINLDGSNRTKLSDDENCYDMSISNNSIYYIKNADLYKPRQIFKVKLDGTDRAEIPTDKLVSSMVTDGNYIYFITNTHTNCRIYKINLDGSGEAKLLELPESSSINTLLVYNGDLYYYYHTSNNVNYPSLYKLSKDGKSSLIKDNLNNARQLSITGDKIYFYQNFDVCRMDLDGSNLENVK